MSESQPPRLELRDIVSTYREQGRRLTALDGLSLSVGAAEFVAVVGPSGSGKSTMLDIIAGLLDPDSGQVLIDGDLTQASQRLGRTAYMQQRDLLLPWRTTVDNAAIGLEATGIPRTVARQQATAQLARFGLEGFGHAWPSQLSGGMRQRVALLRTVLLERDLVLFDEPFGALDALTRAELQTWLAALWEQERTSMLLVTHDVEEAIFLADRVLVLTPRPGRISLALPVSLPRPRSRPMLTSPAFMADRAVLLEALGLLGSPAS